MDYQTPCLATGAQLASRLAKLVPSLLSGSVPACIGRRLATAVDLLERHAARHDALMAATAMLDPGGTLSTWKVSGALSSALQRFDGVAYKRVRSGSRPATALESHLITLIEIPGPRCRESIYRELVGLTELNQ